MALAMGDLRTGAPLLRIHSQCMTGEVFGSLRCDCKDQLELAMQAIAAERRGLVIYEHQEGRGIGLMAKLQTYALQDDGLDTIDANVAIGHAADERDFAFPVAILRELRIDTVRLLTNNLAKVRALKEAGIQVIEVVPCEAAPNVHSHAYLKTKKERMGHTLARVGATPPRPGPSARGTTVVAAAKKAEPTIRTMNRSSFSTHSAITVVPRLSQTASPFARIDDAVAELNAGRMIVVVDDEDRENEGDLTMLADKVTPEAINFMATHGRGLICLAMTGERLDELNLSPMVPQDDNSALHGTAFTVSIDLKGQGCSTGISASDRTQTILAAIDPSTRPEDLGRPGHIFPLRARPGGVLERRGQTEAAVDLARIARLGKGEGLSSASPSHLSAGVICEIVNDDGTMARVPDLIRFCEKHRLLMITVAELARYRAGRGETASPDAHSILGYNEDVVGRLGKAHAELIA
jgi:3,4-dihydroxy-2-butanone 4-phosphate synthase/GTP cyclohydrolase II